MPNRILITGATGNIGSRLAAGFLTGRSLDRVVLLVHGRSNTDSRRRMLDLLDSMPGLSGFRRSPDALEILAGDITEDRLGLDEQTYAALSESVTHIVHAAASTCFTLPLAAARMVNYHGTVNVMRLAARCQERGALAAVAHVSTAYVNGSSRHPIRECTLDLRECFFNSYDRTKWEAERYVRSLAGRLPLVVFRPSIVVGDSQTGYTTAFNVLYAPLRLISRDRVRWLPGFGPTVIDVVPSDYVASAIRHILLQMPRNAGRTYHLVAGFPASMTVEDIVAEARRVFGASRDTQRIRFIPTGWLEGAGRPPEGNDARVDEVLRVFAPFLTSRREFDFTSTREALEGSGISCPPFASYIRTCLEYCVRTNWGKQAPTLPERKHCLEDSGHLEPRFAGGFPKRAAAYC